MAAAFALLLIVAVPYLFWSDKVEGDIFTGAIAHYQKVTQAGAYCASGFSCCSAVGFEPVGLSYIIKANAAVYDNPQSGRPADYIELFDGSGGLLMVGWVDRFGIRRTAMDQGLLQKEASGPEEILVLLLEGVPL